MTASLMPNGKQQYFNSAGGFLVGGKVYTYAAGTTTPKATYTTAAASVSNANPVILDARGEKTIFWNGSYYVEVYDANDVLIYSIDNYQSSNIDASTGSALVGYIAPETGAVATTVQAKLRETRSITDFGSSLATALTGIGSTVMTLIINDDITVSADATIPATLKIRVEKGAVITVSSTKTLTINGQFEAGLHQVFGATGTVLFGKGATDEVFPDWWGAIPDGSTDCQPGTTLALLSLAHTNSEAITLNFGSGNYYYATPVTIYMDAYSDTSGFRFQGTSAISNYNPKGTVITGAAAMTSVFIWRAVALTTPYFLSFECRGISFISGALGTTGPQSALLFKGGGYSSRPVIIENNTFKGFASAIKTDMTGSSLSTGICNVNIRKNFFLNNALALEGVGTDSVVNLDFSNNQAGTGGGINVSLGGPYLISQNTMESNLDSIVITGGLHNGEITRNYFEANTGDLINVSATAPYSSVSIHDNYVYGISGTSIRTSGVHVKSMQDFTWAGVYHRHNLTTGKSVLDCSSTIYPVSLSLGEVFLDVSSVARKTTLNPATLTSGAYSNAVGAAQITPMGEAVNVDTINGAGVARAFTLNALTGDWIVFCALVRKRSGAGNLYIECLNAASTVAIGSSNTNSTLLMAGVGEWVYAMKYFQVTGNSGATINWNWTSDGGAQYDVTSTYIYKVASPTLTTPIYLVCPAI